MTVEAQAASMLRSAAYPKSPDWSLHAQRLALRLWLLGTDAVALAGAYFIAYWVRFGLEVTVSPGVVPPPNFYLFVGLILIPVLLGVFASFRLYDTESLLGGVSEYSKIFNACTAGTMILVLATFVVPQLALSRVWVVAAWLLSFVLVSLSRFLCRRLVYPLRARGYFLTPAVIIGTNQEAATLAVELSNWRSSGLRIAGFVANDGSPSEGGSLPVLGDVRDIRRLVEAHGIEDLIVAITALKREELLLLCEEVNALPGVHLRLSSGVYELLTTGLTVQTKGSVPLVSLNKVRLRPGEAFVKSTLEYSLTILGLLFTWPFFLLIAVLVRLDSPGPILHRRRVLGVSGHQFDAFKFRTMYVNGNEMLRDRPDLLKQLQSDHKLKEDPRVTRMGRFLRKFSLDELPQLFNVLRGEMGLVGPRMITAEEGEKYGRHRMNLLTVKPGITGLWQVSGRSDLSYDERVQLDMYYIRNYSVWMDLQILFVQTIPAVIKGRGAY